VPLAELGIAERLVDRLFPIDVSAVFGREAMETYENQGPSYSCTAY
jgi:hypothetical protein